MQCGRKQNTFRKTCESCVVLYCNTCNAIGHESTECPDLWRRFHQTVSLYINVIYKCFIQLYNLYNYNLNVLIFLLIFVYIIDTNIRDKYTTKFI